MPTVRTTCPTCEVVLVDARAMTLRRRAGLTHAECIFVCPDCVREVVQPLADRMVPVLIGAGCAVEPWDDPRMAHPSMTGCITEDEIAEFRSALDADGWFDELLE